ncbi:N-acetylmuramoyl-L-alanine amidase [Clostridium sp. MB40-C1]|uniref:N-acetylmuramoyl-L-alanine amidase n=1 Tax=Clostridium sp. MB40-C1 TaxID=3070996 RepID=UPI0027DECC66|nr:N-acetylmuramoyl-L-alanine amidase [Clostridium sp. MB40-C1]WMJ79825.1 N-acetylmuramoyl-L-alanine amidase [Clostridium sp. MB40-C1]
MKKCTKFLISIMAFLFLIGINIPPNVFAATSSNIIGKTSVDVNKIWTVKFNNELDKSTIDGKDNVLVLDDKGVKVNTKIEYKDSKTLLISPIKNYDYGKKYTIIVKDTVKSKKGEGMKKAVQMDFTTKSNATQIKTIEDMSQILYKGEKYTLPSVVKAVMSNGTEQNVSIKWDNTYINTLNPGTYNYKGTVSGYDKQVNLKVVVSSSSGVDLSRINKVCIDPAGASNLKLLTGPTGVKDNDVNLAISLKLGKLLEGKGIKVAYTRQKDSVSWNESEDVEKRCKIANDSESEVLISVRSNYYSSSTAEGIETYYLGTDTKGKTLAQQVQKNMISKTNAKDRTSQEIGQNHVKFLQGFKGSGILVYGGFISNPDEEKLLNSSEYQDKIAQGIADSIMHSSSNNTISSVKDINVNVNQGDSYTLPTKVTAIDEKNNSIQADVIWEVSSVDTSNAGTYVIKGRVNNYSKLVTLTIVVSPKKAAKYKICIDPGHGGYDSGTIGYSGTKEKDIALQVSLKVGQLLEKNGIDVVYTRTSDNVPWPPIKEIELKMRCDISNKAKANYFVSIHANSVDGSPSTSGIETLYGSNRTDGIPLAKNIQREMVAATGGRDRGIKERNNIYVVKWPDAPPALVELEFTSNPQKEKLLKTSEYQQKCAEAIVRGIMKTLK